MNFANILEILYYACVAPPSTLSMNKDDFFKEIATAGEKGQEDMEKEVEVNDM